mgnify:CR=1 FL=1
MSPVNIVFMGLFRFEAGKNAEETNLESTSSNVQESLSEFWLISSADVATPPALEALPGQNRTPSVLILQAGFMIRKASMLLY